MVKGKMTNGGNGRVPRGYGKKAPRRANVAVAIIRGQKRVKAIYWTENRLMKLVERVIPDDREQYFGKYMDKIRAVIRKDGSLLGHALPDPKKKVDGYSWADPTRLLYEIERRAPPDRIDPVEYRKVISELDERTAERFQRLVMDFAPAPPKGFGSARVFYEMLKDGCDAYQYFFARDALSGNHVGIVPVRREWSFPQNYVLPAAKIVHVGRIGPEPDGLSPAGRELRKEMRKNGERGIIIDCPDLSMVAHTIDEHGEVRVSPNAQPWEVRTIRRAVKKRSAKKRIRRPADSVLPKKRPTY
jgi:hypothetical protein